MRFIDNVKSIIAKKGFKQKFIAQEMGISERKLSDVLNGRKIIDVNIIEMLCSALDVCPNELFGYEEEWVIWQYTLQQLIKR